MHTPDSPPPPPPPPDKPTIDAPVLDQLPRDAMVADEPGALVPFPITGYVIITHVRDLLPSNVQAYVRIDGIDFPAQMGQVTYGGSDDPNAIVADTHAFSCATARAYRGSATATDYLQVSAWASADHYRPSPAATAQDLYVAMTKPSPTLQVTAPAPPFQPPLDENAGASFPVTATAADSTQFGDHLVVAHTDMGDYQLLPVPGSVTQYATPDGTPARIGPMPLGARSFTVSCACALTPSVSTTVTVPFIAADTTPPRLSVTDPAQSGGRVAVDPATGLVTFHGLAADGQSGMVGGNASVTASLSATGSPAATVAPATAADFRSWTATAAVPPGTAGTLYLWGTDAAGNTNPAPLTWDFQAVSSWVPATLDDRLSEQEYLSVLIDFALKQLATPPKGVGPTSSDLAAVLAQPVDRISVPATWQATAGEQPLNELRVPIEVLRSYLGQQGDVPSYLAAAYQSLITGTGTSSTELRLSRGATDADRAILADRLGLPLYQVPGGPAGARHDQLDALTLDPAALTEQALRQLFGLATTTPFDATTAPPSPTDCALLSWRLEYQRGVWLTQDGQPPANVAYTVLVDPDIITLDDIRADATRVRAILTYRQTELDTQRQALTEARAKAAGDPDGGFQALLVLAGIDLTGLRDQDAKGIDITQQLATAGLDRVGFGYLSQLHDLAGTGGSEVMPAEWSDAIDVLVGAYRRVRYQVWSAPQGPRHQIPEDGIALSPDFFVLTGDPPPAGPLRISPQARRDWQSTLRARTAHQQALRDDHAALVAAAEQASLPLLRDVLLGEVAIAAGQETTTVGAELADRYLVDVQVSGALTTTRIEQAISGMQALLLQVRSGDTEQDLTPDLTGASGQQGWRLQNPSPVFDASWLRIGTLDTWRSTTRNFLFPETGLDPGLLTGDRPHYSLAPTDQFNALCSALQVGPGVAESEVAGLADAYFNGTTNAPGGVVGIVTSWLNARFAGRTFSPFNYLSDHDAVNQSVLADLSARVDGMVPDDAGQPVPGDRDLALEVFWAAPMLIARRLRADGHHQSALDWLWAAYPYNDVSAVSAYDVINDDSGNTHGVPPSPNLTLTDWTVPALGNPFWLVKGFPYLRPYPFLRATLLEIISCLLDYGDTEFGAETAESIVHARTLYGSARRLLGHPCFVPVKPSDPGDAALPVPLLEILRQRVENQLAKLRQDRNIAGLPRTQVISGEAIRQPTPYHFKVLLARAQQLAQQAAGVEGEFLSAMEKYAAGQLQLADAESAVTIALAQSTVHDAQVQTAQDAVKAALAQQQKADTMIDSYTTAMNHPANRYEENLLVNYDDARTAQDLVAGGEFAMGVAQIAQGTSWDKPQSWGAAAVGIAGAAVKFGGQVWLNEINKSMQENQLNSGIENRMRDWRIQLAGAKQDSLVAAAQVTTAQDQVAVAQAEQRVAALQVDHAKAALELLLHQFTSPDMYKWLSDTLGGIYRYFLQQATATARLAQAQLAFERAEPVRTYIGGNYWNQDARGLSGSERLSEDLTKLDQYAFGTDTRRLNISQTFSVSALAPLEFAAFRRTGQISFATPTALFDRDFPGHYQRLIRQAHLSVVALVPPTRGIRATLSSNGVSRVTTMTDTGFSEVLLRRDPSVVSFTSALDATGVFAIDLQPDMLLPFEGSGVDTTWDVSLPPAANPFDFRTISDMLLTVDYTALADWDYRAQVIHLLNADSGRAADRVFSLARDFPDQWYELNNPDPATGLRSAMLSTLPSDFPPNLVPDSLQTSEIAVRLTGGAGVLGVNLVLARNGDTAPAIPTDPTGTVSTRRGAAPWSSHFTGSPVADWRLTFDKTAEPLFTAGALDDVLLVLSWTGQAPPWPT